MIDVDALRCPHCARALQLADRTLRCATGHTFDVARQGHVFLLRGAAPANADTAEMVAARERFLGAGHYAPLAEAIEDWLPSGRIVDAGAGPGWYLARWLAADDARTGIACDVSPAAARRAAKAHPRITSIVADTWAGLPLTAGCADAVVSTFAPRNGAEFARLLAPGGTVVVAAAGPDHLASLRASLGLLDVEAGKRDRAVEQLGEHLTLADERELRWELNLDADAASDLVAMGPNAFHQAPETVVAQATEAHVILLRFTART